MLAASMAMWVHQTLPGVRRTLAGVRCVERVESLECPPADSAVRQGRMRWLPPGEHDVPWRT